MVHYQWLTLEALDAFLLATGAPRVFTSHNVLRRGDGRAARAGGAAGGRPLGRRVAHTAEGARELR